MSIKFKVDRVRDSGVFCAGDEVCGTVEITGPLDFPSYDDTKVNIIFTGSSETTHALGKSVYSDNAIFFQAENVLFLGTLDLRRGASQTWRFSFRFPEQTEPDWGQTKINRKKRYEGFLMTSHPLPQSTALLDNAADRWQVLVSYTLHAKVSGKWGWREDKRALTVVPKPRRVTPPADLAVQSQQFTHYSSRLLAEEATRKRSVNKWLNDKFSSNTPKAVFTITAQTLQTLTPGERIPIHLQLDYDTKKSNLSSFPEIRLLDVTYDIFSKTEIWGDDFMSLAVYRERAGRLAPKFREYTSNLKFDAQFLANGQNINVNQFEAEDGTISHVILDRALVSPFRTYNAVRSYEGVVKVNFECGGKKHTAKFSWPLDIGFSERYMPQTQLNSSNDDSEAVKFVGKMALKGVVTIVTTVLGIGI